jgi:hypothetical protein
VGAKEKGEGRDNMDINERLKALEQVAKGLAEAEASDKDELIAVRLSGDDARLFRALMVFARAEKKKDAVLWVVKKGLMEAMRETRDWIEASKEVEDE